MNKIVTIGEVTMRLSPPGSYKIIQTNSLDITYGGSEFNVGVSLAYFGEKAYHVGRFPKDSIGQAALAFMRKNNVGTDYIRQGDGNMGLYFLEVGALSRSSQVTYNRNHSVFVDINPFEYDWDEIFRDADWFHWSAITPSISAGACSTLLIALQKAKEHGVTVTGDMNMRSNMWKFGITPEQALPAFLQYTDIVIGGWYDIRTIWGTDLSGAEDPRQAGTEFYFEKLPHLKMVCDKTRDSINASHQRIQAHIWDRSRRYDSQWIELEPVVDRIGTGDAYAAGLIYGLLNMDEPQLVCEFANAACALKHSIQGDENLVSAEEVMKLVRFGFNEDISQTTR